MPATTPASTSAYAWSSSARLVQCLLLLLPAACLCSTGTLVHFLSCLSPCTTGRAFVACAMLLSRTVRGLRTSQFSLQHVLPNGWFYYCCFRRWPQTLYVYTSALLFCCLYERTFAHSCLYAVRDQQPRSFCLYFSATYHLRLPGAPTEGSWRWHSQYRRKENACAGAGAGVPLPRLRCAAYRRAFAAALRLECPFILFGRYATPSPAGPLCPQTCCLQGCGILLGLPSSLSTSMLHVSLPYRLAFPLSGA